MSPHILTGSQQEWKEAPRIDFCPIFPLGKAALTRLWLGLPLAVTSYPAEQVPV